MESSITSTTLARHPRYRLRVVPSTPFSSMPVLPFTRPNLFPYTAQPTKTRIPPERGQRHCHSSPPHCTGAQLTLCSKHYTLRCLLSSPPLRICHDCCPIVSGQVGTCIGLFPLSSVSICSHILSLCLGTVLTFFEAVAAASLCRLATPLLISPLLAMIAMLYSTFCLCVCDNNNCTAPPRCANLIPWHRRHHSRR